MHVLISFQEMFLLKTKTKGQNVGFKIVHIFVLKVLEDEYFRN